MERFDGVRAFLGGFGIEIEPFTPHRTGAASKIVDFYGPEQVEIVKRYYADDFVVFGYSTDPAVLEPANPPTYPVDGKSKLRQLILNRCPSVSAPRRWRLFG